MVKALIELDDETNRTLNLIKAQHGLKDKSQAIAFLVKHGTSESAQPTVTKYLHDGDTWMLAEDIPDMDFFFLQIPLRCFVNEFDDPSGRAYKKMLSVQTGYHLLFYFADKDAYAVGENIVEKIFRDPHFAKTVNTEIVRHANKLRAYCDTIDKNKLGSLTNAQLWDIFETQGKIHTAYYQYCWIPVAADMFHNNLTARLQRELKNKGFAPEQANEHFMVLTQPTHKSLIQIEHEEFLELAITIAKDKGQRKVFEGLYRNFRDQEVAKFGYKTHTKEYEEQLERKASQLISLIKPSSLKLIKKHHDKYFYVSHMWVGKAATFEHYLKELMVLLATHADIPATLKDAQREFEESTARREKLLAKLKLEPRLISIFDEFGEFMVTKIHRRYAQIYAMYKMEFVQEEFAKRLGITLMQARFLLPEERRKALLEGTIDRAELEERAKFCAYYAEKNVDIMYTAAKAHELDEAAKRVEVKEISTFTGQIGCMGKAKGIVRVIIRPQDMHKMKQGDILVSIATDPDIVPAMKKAAAIVTEQGGVTSHAAIVSRELGIPCVIGTKIATKVLKDGDLVEVDANKGIVTIVKKA